MTNSLIVLTDTEKQEIDDRLIPLEKLQWEVGQYTFYDFVDHFDLPQVVNVKKHIQNNSPTDLYLFLHSIFDRYAIIGKNEANVYYLLSDWCKHTCRILSKTPILKTRWWVFQSAFELFRFEFPRKIKILSHIPVHMKTSNDPKDHWVKVVLKKNVFLTAIHKCTYQSILPNDQLSASKEGFILKDEFGGEYIIPPAVPLRFSTEIQTNEIQPEYKNHLGEFSLSEVLMRYEFPITVSINLPNSPASPLVLQLTHFCVAKSIMAVSFGPRSEAVVMELSPEKDFLIHCHRSLTANLPRNGDEMEDQDSSVEVSELNKYNEILSKMYASLNRPIDVLKGVIREATPEEVSSVRKAHEISVALDKEIRNKNRNPVYMSSEEAIKMMMSKSEVEGVPFDQNQPSNFTVHICADPANPYNEAIDYELLEEESQGNKNGGGQGGPSTQKLCEAVVMQSDDCESIPKEVFAKTISDIPNNLLLVSLSHKDDQ